MRRAGRTDGNHAAVVKALRAHGATVVYIQSPLDLLVGYYGRTVLMEVKDGAKPPSKCKLTPKEQEFIETWPGGAFVVYSPEDAVSALESLGKRVCAKCGGQT